MKCLSYYKVVINTKIGIEIKKRIMRVHAANATTSPPRAAVFADDIWCSFLNCPTERFKRNESYVTP